jgi:VIT1/CCC1 family predicted Fe2+/Mn2+ transporter
LNKEAEFCGDELFDHLVYRELASMERDPELKSILEMFSEQERRHYEFWRSLAGGCGSVSMLKVKLYVLARRLLGLTFTLKFLERHESSVVEEYKAYLERLEGPAREELERIIRDEVEHERSFLNRLAEMENLVRYLGFIALGLADSIVEITGVHAGFLGATATTLAAGVAGLIVGLSAAIAMAGAAYLQAKHGGVGERLRPGTSAIATGASYFFAVVLLAIPYFLTESMLLAFTASLAVAVALTVLFTVYSSVINDRDVRSEVTENLLILTGVTVASFLFGTFIGEVTGLKGLIHH